MQEPLQTGSTQQGLAILLNASKEGVTEVRIFLFPYCNGQPDYGIMLLLYTSNHKQILEITFLEFILLLALSNLKYMLQLVCWTR